MTTFKQTAARRRETKITISSHLLLSVSVILRHSGKDGRAVPKDIFVMWEKLQYLHDLQHTDRTRQPFSDQSTPSTAEY